MLPLSAPQICYSCRVASRASSKPPCSLSLCNFLSTPTLPRGTRQGDTNGRLFPRPCAGSAARGVLHFEIMTRLLPFQPEVTCLLAPAAVSGRMVIIPVCRPRSSMSRGLRRREQRRAEPRRAPEPARTSLLRGALQQGLHVHSDGDQRAARGGGGTRSWALKVMYIKYNQI